MDRFFVHGQYRYRSLEFDQVHLNFFKKVIRRVRFALLYIVKIFSWGSTVYIIPTFSTLCLYWRILSEMYRYRHLLPFLPFSF